MNCNQEDNNLCFRDKNLKNCKTICRFWYGSFIY